MKIITRYLRYLIIVFLMVALLAIVGCTPTTLEPKKESSPLASNPTTPASAPSPDLDVPADEQLAALSLDQKLGQLILIGLEGPALDSEMRELIAERYVGGIILYKRNIENLDQTVSLVNELHTANRGYHVPLFLSVDQEGGTVDRLFAELGRVPDYLQFGQANDPELAYRLGKVLGDELKLIGLNMNYAPLLDVHSNPDNPITKVRSLGTEPELVAQLGSQTMQGLQDANVIPVVKHFPGHGDTGMDSHLELPVILKSTEELHNLELIPFTRTIADGADVIMVGHLLVPNMDPELPASMSSALVTDLLRKDMRFEGVAITDDITMGAITEHFGLGEAVVQSIIAGIDIVMVAHGGDQATISLDALHQAVRDGVLTEQRIDESVKRILALKSKYGLTNETVPKPDSRAVKAAVKELSVDVRQAVKSAKR